MRAVVFLYRSNFILEKQKIWRNGRWMNPASLLHKQNRQQFQDLMDSLERNSDWIKCSVNVNIGLQIASGILA